MTMLLFDNHNHSQFSFDGKRTSVEASSDAAISLGLGGICFTDHCDFFIPPMKASLGEIGPETFDINAQQAEIDRMRASIQAKEQRLKILKGIEIGMYESCRDEIRRTLHENTFDQVIASVHYLDGTDPFYGGYYEGKDWKEAYGHYLETIYREMTWLGDFDIMGHFDYVARYAPYPQASILYRDFSDILDEMLLYLAHEGKALEINTKSYKSHNGRVQVLDNDILLRYRDLGGEVISLGSDSHDAGRVGDGFAAHAAMLKSLGFRYLAHFENRRLIQLPI